MSLLGKSINEVIQTIYQAIKSKRDIIASIRSEYLTPNNINMTVSINRFKLIDLLDEFEITIGQSLQGIQTLQTEICNLQEAQKAEGLKVQLQSQDSQSCFHPIMPHHLNDELMFDSVPTYIPINNSINESVSNITSISQVYHKPKAAKPLNTNARLIFEYGANKINEMKMLNNNSNTIDTQFNQKNKQIKDLLTSSSEIEGEPIEQDKSRLPIRQSIRAGLSKQALINKDKGKDKDKDKDKVINATKSINHNSSSHSNKKPLNDNSTINKEEIMTKLNQIEKEKNYQLMLRKISRNETYKIYFGDKYGNGDYEEFVRQCNRKEKDFDEIQKEFTIMEYIIKSESKKTSMLPYNNHNLIKTNSNPSSLINTNSSKSMTIETNNYSNYISNSISKIDNPPKSRRNSSISKTESSFTVKSSQKETNQPNPYIEPINFSSNYLRGQRSKSQRSNSKVKDIKSNHYKSNQTIKNNQSSTE